MADIARLDEAYNWNITKIGEAFGLHRDTVRKRLKEAGVLPVGIKSGTKVYSLKAVGPALFGEAFKADDNNDPDKMHPKDRKDWFQSENEKLKLEKDKRLLIPVNETHAEMSQLAKAVTNSLDSLSDMLERDVGLEPEAIERVEQVTDNLREQMYQVIILDDEGDFDE